MSKQWCLYLFAIDLLLEMIAIALGKAEMRYVTKPVLMILLFLYVTLQPFRNTMARTLLQLALIFSLVGDISLLFDQRSEMYFIAGLVSFLIAHLFYIIFFIWTMRINQPGRQWDLKVIFVMMIYVAGLLYWLYPRLGSLKIPVFIYAAVLSMMFIAALHAFAVRRQVAGFFCVSGALLFLLSDSLLAINKFYSSFLFANLLIMLTYALAQLFIIIGASSWLRKYSPA